MLWGGSCHDCLPTEFMIDKVSFTLLWLLLQGSAETTSFVNLPFNLLSPVKDSAQSERASETTTQIVRKTEVKGGT